MGILKLADKHGFGKLEKACEKALGFTPRPSYKSINLILQNTPDSTTNETTDELSEVNPKAGFIRGADYYGGNS